LDPRYSHEIRRFSDGKTLTAVTIHETGQPKALSIVYDKM